MTGHSIYERLGDWPGYLSVAATLLVAFVPLARLRRRQKDGGKSSK